MIIFFLFLSPSSSVVSASFHFPCILSCCASLLLFFIHAYLRFPVLFPRIIWGSNPLCSLLLFLDSCLRFCLVPCLIAARRGLLSAALGDLISSGKTLSLLQLLRTCSALEVRWVTISTFPFFLSAQTPVPVASTGGRGFHACCVRDSTLRGWHVRR